MRPPGPNSSRWSAGPDADLVIDPKHAGHILREPHGAIPLLEAGHDAPQRHAVGQDDLERQRRPRRQLHGPGPGGQAGRADDDLGGAHRGRNHPRRDLARQEEEAAQVTRSFPSIEQAPALELVPCPAFGPIATELAA